MVVEHKHKIGFKGTILIEPKPLEPTKHQYDYDVATVYGFLRATGWRTRSRSTSRPTTRRWRATASSTKSPPRSSLGIFGSLDINRGDTQCGWDTDQFPNNLPETALALYRRAARRGLHAPADSTSTPSCAASPSTRPTCSTATSAVSTHRPRAAGGRRMVTDGRMARDLDARYAGWDGPVGQKLLSPGTSLEDAAAHALQRDVDERPVSGRQEAWENLVNEFTR